MAPPRKWLAGLGDRFGRWVVLGEAAYGVRSVRRVECVCDCGVRRSVQVHRLVTGQSLSCGCLARELMGGVKRRHGCGWPRTAEYRAWLGMKRRCAAPAERCYPDYGGRGIRVCERWAHSFEAFLADVGERPSALHTLDRIDNDGNYEPGNVRWASKSEQAQNRRSSVLLEWRGERLVVAEWARRLGMSPSVLERRVKAGWSAGRVLTEPLHAEKSRPQVKRAA